MASKMKALVVDDLEGNLKLIDSFLLSSFRGDAARRSMKVIMLSALDSPEVAARCRKLGADSYIVKPFTKQKMDAALSECGASGKAG